MTTCAHCGKPLEPMTPDEDAAAHAEAQANWSKDGSAPGMVVMCDECYHALMHWIEVKKIAQSN